ncbi:uncharacterized protein LOC122042370 [Zingiber officinale]|uniref:uncharacterized protein LOC122042370 n=1 Tax=Zingiber officinale TaxID=94328 RepID=UPI001C4CD968|nr:uncharacterized protein LOC122042370 [Zingiber officinale]
MVSNIQKSGHGIQPPTAYKIAGPYLDEQVEEIKTWILSCKKQWSLYGVTLMCDGWTGPTRMSIINFLLYCNRKVIFHKSIDATTDYHDAPYIFRLMDSVVHEIGAEHIVQVITDNGANFKRAGEMLEQRYRTLFWTPCAPHCIDLMMTDIGKLDIVKKVVKKGQSLTKFIYNHHWVHGLMRKFIDGEILRPGATRFATHFLLLKSLNQKKVGLKAMFSSEDWEVSRYSNTTEGKEVQKIIMSVRFWDYIADILIAVEPLYVVLRKVDMDKKPQMSIVYRLIHEAKEEIKRRLQSSTKYQHYIDIITTRWDDQMGKPIHLAGYYLNPAYQYRYNLGTNDDLLVALRHVISRLHTNTESIAETINESRLFREAYGSFSDSIAVSCRYKMDAGKYSKNYF